MGGSTISMQLARLHKNNPKRTLINKLHEIWIAIVFEIKFSKTDILKMYVSNAPYGGNVVGAETAAWRYFGRDINNLSLAEYATLAVLPNSPALIHPGRNRSKLKFKRDALLKMMLDKGLIDETNFKLAKLENIPDKPFPIPQLAIHLMQSIVNGRLNLVSKSWFYKTTIDKKLQQNVVEVLDNHHISLLANHIKNACVIVMEVNTGNVVAYVGNVYKPDNPELDSHVDVITSKRSPGSILKPLLYESALTDGQILPHSLLADIPTQIGGYTPQNFDKGYDGAIAASAALGRSLNIPAVRMLHDYRVERFYERLKQFGISTLNRSPGEYGLSLILGGGENSLWELAGVYASMGRLLNHFNATSLYYQDNYRMPNVESKITMQKTGHARKHPYIQNAASVFYTFEAMNEIARPGEEAMWNRFESSYKIAWKTGTSYGLRDGWAIGLTPQYLVGVWVGNATGEGRQGLIGVQTAAPIMFDVFRLLPRFNTWFSPPYPAMQPQTICKKSGNISNGTCNETETVYLPNVENAAPVCQYHRIIFLDETMKWQVNASCYPMNKSVGLPWFVLTPAMEYYYKFKDLGYKSLPQLQASCVNNEIKMMELIYPKQSKTMIIPIEMSGQKGRAIFKVAHRSPEAVLYWYLNDEFVGTTQSVNQMEIKTAKGSHMMLIVDNEGNELRFNFKVVSE
jgi:penicillin-binding protein 1C